MYSFTDTFKGYFSKLPKKPSFPFSTHTDYMIVGFYKYGFLSLRLGTLQKKVKILLETGRSFTVTHLSQQIRRREFCRWESN